MKRSCIPLAKKSTIVCEWKFLASITQTRMWIRSVRGCNFFYFCCWNFKQVLLWRFDINEWFTWYAFIKRSSMPFGYWIACFCILVNNLCPMQQAKCHSIQEFILQLMKSFSEWCIISSIDPDFPAGHSETSYLTHKTFIFVSKVAGQKTYFFTKLTA